MAFEDHISIDGRIIGKGAPPYMIAELSGNHEGRIEHALNMIEAAAKCGVDAVKIQTYRADTITIDHDGPEFRLEGGLWKGRTLYDLYEEAHTPWEWHKSLFQKAKEVGVTLFSSPFDETAIELLESLGCPAYKIASFEIVDLNLIKKAASTGKPLIISTGLANLGEIEEALSVAKTGTGGVALLYCISGYPTPAEEANLRTMVDMASHFDVPIGLSDHTLGNDVSIAAVALGATVIEKHFTMARADGGVDSAFSLEPDEFQSLVTSCRTVHSALGEVTYDLKPSEEGGRAFRRSLYVVADIEKGEAFSHENVRSIRPGLGLHTRYLPELLAGGMASQPIKRGTALTWKHVEGGEPS